MKFDRAYRRFMNANIKKRRKNYYGGTNSPGKLLNTATPCSCHMCGSPRKWFGELKIQERRFFCDYQDDYC